ncbi:MAG TPA: hypothetical protein VM389_06500, partial [Phycisphaerae bacterium]|nr:hypothetical protein [Phycisphaerae bacterium]
MNRAGLYSVSVAAVALGLLGCKEDRSFGSDGDDDDVPEGCDVVSGAVATGLDITAVAVYQGVRIPLLE